VQDRLEFAKKMYELLERRDLEGFLANVHPDVEFLSLVAEAEGGTYRGHDGVRRWWDQVAEAMGGLRFVPQRMEEVGDGICVEIRVTGTVDEVDVSQVMFQAVRTRDELVGGWTTTRTEEEARAWLEEGGP
jgi:ketosteroid isomerase-like protein